jgi:large subunit ribosomal protein L21
MEHTMPRKKKAKQPIVSIVEQGGFQFTVTEGDTIQVPQIEEEEGNEVSLEKVLLVREGDAVKVGAPEVEGASVRAKVVVHGKNDKVLVVKKKKRKDYKRRNGHRQPFTQLQITSIKA